MCINIKLVHILLLLLVRKVNDVKKVKMFNIIGSNYLYFTQLNIMSDFIRMIKEVGFRNRFL